MTTQIQGERQGPDGFVYPADTTWGDFTDGTSIREKYKRGADTVGEIGNKALQGILRDEAYHYGVLPGQDSQPIDSRSGEGDSSESSAAPHEL